MTLSDGGWKRRFEENIYFLYYMFYSFFSHVGKFKIKPSFKAGLYVFNVHTKFCFDKMLIKFDNI